MNGLLNSYQRFLKKVPVVWALIVPIVLVLMFFISCVILILLYRHSNELKTSNAELDIQLSDSEAHVSELTSKINYQESKISELENEIDNLENQITDLEYDALINSSRSYSPTTSLSTKCKDSPLPDLSLSIIDKEEFERQKEKHNKCWGF